MTRREPVRACIHPETYKYFLARDTVLETWQRLALSYGEPVVTAGFGVVEIRTTPFLIRATRMLNPVTVIRLRRCTDADVQALHVLLAFQPDGIAA
jgi:hypothetical protein